MPNQFFSPEGDIENYFVSEYWLIDQYIGDQLWTWGRGSNGRLGTNDVTDRSTPVTTFAGGTNWKQVSSGGYHTAAIKTDGTLWIWGNGSGGQLGNADTTDRSTPVTTFAGGNDWKQVKAHNRGSTLAIKTDGTLWTWGNGGSGVLGIDENSNILTPITTFAGGTNWADTATTEPEDLYTLSAGNTHTAAIKTDGTLWTWGNGGNGQLGNASITLTNSTPVTTFAGGNNWRQISAGTIHTAAIKTDGTLWTWGNGSNGRLGNGETTISNKSTPVTTFAGGNNWKQVSAGNGHTAAIKTDGTLWTWGYGSNGKLGNAVTTGNISTPVTTFAGGTNWKQVSSAGYHTAAIKTDGTLWTWGSGSSGRLGTNDLTSRSTPVTTFAGGTNWKQVSAGGHTAAIKTDGTLWTWGLESNGRLGTNYTTNILTPITTFAGGTNWADTATAEPEDLYTLSAGGHTAAIKTDGTLWVWGNGSQGQLGTNSISIHYIPSTTFSGGTNWKQVSSGITHTTAIKTDGTLWTWGNGGFGQLGTNDVTDRSTPITTFAGGTNWKQVSAGRQHTSAIKTDGTLWTWGNGRDGRLGDLQFNDRYTPVTTFAGGTNWADTATTEPEDLYTLSAGNTHTAAIKTDGTLWIWGNGGNGQLGNASITLTNSTPVTTFAGGTNWKQVSAGGFHTAAIKTDGTLWSWGTGSNGQLGINNPPTINTPITTFAGGTNWADTATTEPEDLYTLSAGNNNALAIKTDGTLWGWGNGSDGRLGTNDTTIISTPVTTFAGGTNWKQISSGSRSTAAIKTDGTLWTWGRGFYGQLGTNDTTQRNTPVTTFAGGTNWKQVSVGYNFISAIKTDGTLWVWGAGVSGRLGTNDTTQRNTPVTTFAGGTNWKQVSAGVRYAAAIKTDGTLWTWGNNGSGQLGNVTVGGNVLTPVTTFAGGTDWKQVSAGMGSSVNFNALTAAIKTDGTLWTWGYGFSGQLGTNNTTNTSTPVTTFSGGTDWKQVSAGNGHTAAIKTDGTLWVWGVGISGQLGNAETFSRSTPVTTFAGGTNWKQVSAGQNYTVALRDDGINKEVFTWGARYDGLLGDNYAPNRSTPVTTFSGGTDWKQVSSGGAYTAAIKTDGTLWTWGRGGYGRLGTNDLIDRYTPVTTFAGGTNWKQVSAGSFHTAAIKTDGTLWSWGYGRNGRLGDATITNKSTPVTTFAGGTDWKQVSAGTNHTVAIKTDGTLWTWGYGRDGRLGTQIDTTDRSTPVTTFAGGTNWKQVSAGDRHTAAIKTDGTLWTWGNGYSGRLGTNDRTEKLTPVTTFAGGTNWKQVSAGDRHTAALRDDGVNKELFTWGSGYSGRLGTKTVLVNINISTPITTFVGGTNWKQVSVGYRHTAAIKTDGTLWTWGNGSQGQLGTNSISIHYIPSTTFSGGTNWKQVSSGITHTTAIKTDGTLWVWGESGQGRLGTNDAVNRSTPVTTFAGGTDWKQVSAGRDHTAAIKTDGTLWVWGYGRNGKLGTNDLIDRYTPVTTFAGETNWKQVSAGYNHTAALRDDGVNKELFTWGAKSEGRLGNALVLGDRSTPVTTFAGGTNWKQVSAGTNHTVAIKTDGTLWTWGYGGSGRLGTNDRTEKLTPVTTFAGGTNWKQVSAGTNHTVALRDDGVNKELFTWGAKSEGRLGNTSVINANRSTPVTTFAGGTNWKQVSAGESSAAAIKTDGTLWVWGSDSFDTLGTGKDGTKYTPVTTFAGGNNWKQVDVGTYRMAAIKTDGTLWGWGSANDGQLAVGDTNGRSTPVTTIVGGTNWKQVSCAPSGNFIAAIKTDGTLWMWGNGSGGQLGNATPTGSRSTPVTTFAGGTNWKQVSAGQNRTAAIKTDGTLWSWGFGSNGQLGNANVTSFPYTSTPVTTFAGGSNWKQVSAAGQNRTAAVTTGISPDLPLS